MIRCFRSRESSLLCLHEEKVENRRRMTQKMQMESRREAKDQDGCRQKDSENRGGRSEKRGKEGRLAAETERQQEQREEEEKKG